MEAPKRKESPGLFQADGKIARTQELAPINRLPADIIRHIFSYWSWDPRKLAVGRAVCHQWRRILNDPLTMRMLVPTVGCSTFGIRFSCKQLVNLANRYTRGLPTLDLDYTRSINEADLALLNPGIQNIKVRNAKINDAQIAILISKLAKRGASLTIELTSRDPVDMVAVFNALRAHQVQLRKLKIRNYAIDEDPIKVRNAFILFVNADGLCEQSCELSLHVGWLDCEVLACLNRKNIHLSMFRSTFEVVHDSKDQFYETLASSIRRGLLKQKCDFGKIAGESQRSKKVIDALLETGIQIKHFDSIPHHVTLEHGSDVEFNRRKAFFTTVERLNSPPVCKGLTQSYNLSILAPDMIEVGPHILASSSRIKALHVDADLLVYERSDFTQLICDIIQSAKLAESYRLRLKEDMWNNSIFEALAKSSIRMGHFSVIFDGSQSSISRPRQPLTSSAYHHFLLALSRRQSSIEMLELLSYHDHCVFLDQSAIDTLTEMGRQGFRFRCLKLQNFDGRASPLNLLPLVQSKALSECVSLELKIKLENLTETLQGLINSDIRNLHIQISSDQLALISNFFSSHRFKCLVDWDISITHLDPQYELLVNVLKNRYFGIE